MKQIFLILLALFLVQPIIGQEDDSPDFKNEIGFDFLGVIDGQYLLVYERGFNEHWTGSIGFGIKSPDGLINLSGLDTESITTGDLTYNGFKLLLEGKYYLNPEKYGGTKGFYVGGYAKYSNFSSDLIGIYTDDMMTEFMVDIDADFSIVSIGFMVGYKLPISKRLNIDFLIAGPGVGFYNFKTVNNNPLPDSFYDDLNEALSEYKVFDYINGDFNFRLNNSKSDFSATSFRYGMKLNYSF